MENDRIINALAVVPAALFPSAASAAGEASSLGRDTAGTFTPSPESD